MAQNGVKRTLCDFSWAQNYPDAPKQGTKFYHAGGVEADAMEVLRGKGYTPVDFRGLEGEEQLEAMMKASNAGVFDPNPAQIKMLDLHLKHLKTKEVEQEGDQRTTAVTILGILDDFASQKRPPWVERSNPVADVVVSPTSSVADLLKSVLG